MKYANRAAMHTKNHFCRRLFTLAKIGSMEFAFSPPSQPFKKIVNTKTVQFCTSWVVRAQTGRKRSGFCSTNPFLGLYVLKPVEKGQVSALYFQFLGSTCSNWLTTGLCSKEQLQRNTFTPHPTDQKSII